MKYFIILLGILLACHQPSKPAKGLIALQKSKVTASLRGLDVVNAQIAWASGTQGTVLRTTDGGKHWQNVSIAQADTIDFRDIEAFTATEAVVLSAGFPGVIYKTSNGGITWQLVYRDMRPTIFFDAMDYWNKDEGIAFGDAIDGRIVLIRTHDGGSTWQPIAANNAPEALVGEGGFAASGTCLTTFGDSSVWLALGTPNSRILFSADRGTNWQAFNTPMAQKKVGAGIFSLAFSSAKYGIAVGGSYMNPSDTTNVISITDDGGKTWQLLTNHNLNGYKSAIAHVPNSLKWLATGPTGTSYSTDNGKHWSLIDTTAFHTIVLDNQLTAWLTGGHGKIGKMILQ